MSAPMGYDEVAARYNAKIDPEGHGLNDPVLADLLGDVTSNDFLSLACGQGRDARFLADLGAKVTGVDASDRLLTYAREFEREHPRGIQYMHADAHELAPLATASFDGVVCYMALMDIPGLEATTSAVARVLRPGGVFVASVVHPCFRPHLDAIDDYLADEAYAKPPERPDWLPPHAFHRPLSTYVNALANAGLSITRMVEPRDEERDPHSVPGLLYLHCVRQLR